VRLLLDLGADPHLRTISTQTNSSGASALIVAIQNCQQPSPLRDIVEALLTVDSDIEALGDFGKSVLHLAAINSSDPQLFNMLITAGASLEVFNHSGETPLHNAVRYGSRGAVEALLIAGANPYRVDKNNSSALHAAIWGCKLVVRKQRERVPIMLEFLLDLGIDPNAQDDQGRSALDLAEEKNCAAEVVTLLRERM
jgi:ankyrin repeat protein